MGRSTERALRRIRTAGVAGMAFNNHFKLRKEARQLPSGQVGRELIHGLRSVLFVADTRYRVQGKRSPRTRNRF